MATSDKSKIKSLVEKVVRERITADIVDVDIAVDEAANNDGDLILVTVIYDGKRKNLDTRETSQITRHVWKRLIDSDISGFPSFSFIAKSEARKLAAA